MSELAPKIEDTGVQIRGATNSSALANLFQGVGNAAMQAVQITDQAVQGRIDTDTTKVFEESMQPYEAMAGLPTEISQGEERMEVLQQALEQGKISDTQFYGQLVSNVKKLKSKYPGYADVVDQMIQSKTGIRPANALRSAILSEISAANQAEDSRRSDWEKFILRGDVQEQVGGAFPDIFTNPQKYDDPAQQALVKQKFSQGQSYKAELDIIKSELAVDSARFNQNERIIKQKTNSFMGNVVNEAIAGISRSAESTYGVNFNKLASDVSSGRTQIEPQALEDLRTQIGIRRNEVAQQLTKEITESTNGFISPSDLRGQLDDAMKPFDDIIAMMGSGDYDLAGQAARSTEIIQDRQLNDLLVGSKDLRLIGALKQISPDLADKFIQGDKGSQLTKVIESINLQNMNFEGQSLGDAIESTMKSINLNDGEAIRGVRGTIEGVVTQLGDPKGDPEKLSEVGRAVFNDQDIFKNFGDTSQVEIFKRLTSKKITQNIVKSGDQELIQKYYNWAINSSYKINDVKDTFQAINAIQQTGEFLFAELDSNGKLIMRADQEAFQEWSKTKSPASIREMVSNIQEAVDGISTFNAFADNLNPIIKANGKDPKQDLGSLLQNLAVDTDTRRTGILQKLFDVIGGGTGGELFPSEGKGKEALKLLEEVVLGVPELQSSAINSTPDGSFKPVVNTSMKPIFDTEGASKLTRKGAEQRMDKVLQGPYKSLQESFKAVTGKDVVINDAIAKSGTSRERNTKGSRHFHGDAIDLSTRGMSDKEKQLLVEKAKAAGFTGFGFGENILHVDMGPKRAWSYGNPYFGGRRSKEMISSVKR